MPIFHAPFIFIVWTSFYTLQAYAQLSNPNSHSTDQIDFCYLNIYLFDNLMDTHIFTKKYMYWHENQSNRERKYKYNVSMREKIVIK